MHNRTLLADTHKSALENNGRIKFRIRREGIEQLLRNVEVACGETGHVYGDAHVALQGAGLILEVTRRATQTSGRMSLEISLSRGGMRSVLHKENRENESDQSGAVEEK